MSFLKSLYQKAIAWSYTIGLVDYSDNIVLDPDAVPKVHWVRGIPIGHWFADPFILTVTEDFFVILVEDYSFNKNKGQISKVLVDRKNYRVRGISTVLNTGTHLSFPAYFRENGHLYLYPENCKSGRLNLYEYDCENNDVSFSRILNPYPIADAVIMSINGKKVITGTLFPKDNGKELMVYPYFEIECPENVAPIQTILFNDNSARNAGMPFYISGNMYRPAQNSNHRYGECLVLQKVEVDSEGKLIINEQKRIKSPSKRYNLSFHTFNVYQNKYVAVDASGYRFCPLGRVLEWIRMCFVN